MSQENRSWPTEEDWDMPSMARRTGLQIDIGSQRRILFLNSHWSTAGPVITQCCRYRSAVQANTPLEAGIGLMGAAGRC